MNDTIAAISTTTGIGAISIIRLSGPESLEIASKVFTKDLTKVETHTIHYGYIKNNNEKIDEVLVSVMKAPKTFTKEDIVEINCHGGIATTNKVLEILLNNGARLAEPGEFTKRAFLNGRIDLLEAEATMDLISSKSDKARKMSLNTLTGETSNLIKDLRSDIVGIISNIEVNIDYPEYEDIEVLTNEKILPEIQKFKEKLEKIIKKSQDSKVIKEGIKVGIIGKPNVGNEADLVIFILNNNEKITAEEKGLLEKLKDKKKIIVINKIDLENKLDKSLLDNYIEISAKENIGIEKIKDEIKRLFNLGELEASDLTYMSNARSISLLGKSLNNINDAISEINNNSPIDIVEFHLKDAWNNLGEIIGETYTDELLDELFSRFCLGK